VTSALLQPAGATFGDSAEELLRNAAVVGIPGWAVLSVILLFYGWLTYLVFAHSKEPGELAHGQVHV
jgi:uncharacterized membrane protein